MLASRWRYIISFLSGLCCQLLFSSLLRLHTSLVGAAAFEKQRVVHSYLKVVDVVIIYGKVQDMERCAGRRGVQGCILMACRPDVEPHASQPETRLEMIKIRIDKNACIKS